MKNITILLAIVLISTFCHGKKVKYTYTDTTFNHISFKEVTFTLDKKTKDTLKIEGLLKQKTIINGIPCFGNIGFVKNWELEKFTLADEHTFGGYTFPKDTYIGLNVDRFNLKTHYLVMAGADSVNTCKFPSNHLINGLLCDSIEGAIFTTDWDLRACILGDDDTIAGNVFRKGSLAVFGKSGRIYIYCLYDPIIQGYLCSGTNYKGLLWEGGGGIHLYPSGKLRRFHPPDDIEIQGVLCKSSSIHLYESEKLQSFKPPDDIEIQGVFCKSSCHRCKIHFYESGKLKQCVIGKDQTIDGELYKKKITLEFDEEGNVTKSYKAKFFN